MTHGFKVWNLNYIKVCHAFLAGFLCFRAFPCWSVYLWISVDDWRTSESRERKLPSANGGLDIYWMWLRISVGALPRRAASNSLHASDLFFLASPNDLTKVFFLGLTHPWKDQILLLIIATESFRGWSNHFLPTHDATSSKQARSQ